MLKRIAGRIFETPLSIPSRIIEFHEHFQNGIGEEIMAQRTVSRVNDSQICYCQSLLYLSRFSSHRLERGRRIYIDSVSSERSIEGPSCASPSILSRIGRVLLNA